MFHTWIYVLSSLHSMSSWKAQFKEAGRQSVTHQVPWGALPACPGTSTKGTLDGPSATAGTRPLSALTDHPGDGIFVKQLTEPPVPSLPRISWGLSSAAVQTGMVSHSTVYIICNHYLGSLPSYWILIKSPSFCSENCTYWFYQINTNGKIT